MALNYKEGDRVLIKSLGWYNDNKDEDGGVSCGEYDFIFEMTKFCGKILTIDVDFEDGTYQMAEDRDGFVFTVEMFEGLVEEEIKPKFKVGDRIISDVFSTKDDKGWEVIHVERTGYKLISVNNPNLICDMDFKNEHYYKLVEKESKFGTALNPIEPKSNANCLTPKFKVGDKVILDPYPCTVTDVHWRDSLHGFVYTVRGTDFGKIVKEDDLVFDESPTPSIDKIIKTIKADWDNFKNRYNIPNDYHFVDKDGNEINISEIVLEKKKKEYPKTYEECCKVLGIGINGHYTAGYKSNTLSIFQNLLICRNAYWKLAGEEMGLGKPWENSKFEIVYGICRDEGIIVKRDDYWGDTHAFEFPIREVRDAFKENFGPDIEICKELL